MAASIAPAVDWRTIRQRFDRGVDWALENVGGFSSDARLAVLAGLLLTDPERAETVRGILRNRQEIRLSVFGRFLDVLTLGEVGRRLRKRRSEAEAFFVLMERDPSPLVRTDIDSFRYVPASFPESLEDLHRIDGECTGAALVQASRGRLEEPVLSWLRREDLWGYNLAHQLLAWVVCHKAGHREEEARERSGRFAWRLFHEVEHGPQSTHYDLFAERIAFLLLAGFPPKRLTRQFHHIVASQDPEDGGWWFTRVPADQATLLENVHLGSSPLVRPSKSYRDQKDPDAARRRLEILHRGHSTGLSLWALSLWLRTAPTLPNQGSSVEIPASPAVPDRDLQS
jgi:hypothetical protein